MDPELFYIFVGTHTAFLAAASSPSSVLYPYLTAGYTLLFKHPSHTDMTGLHVFDWVFEAPNNAGTTGYVDSRMLPIGLGDQVSVPAHGIGTVVTLNGAGSIGVQLQSGSGVQTMLANTTTLINDFKQP